MLDLTTAFATFPLRETQRCLLRAITLADTPAIFAIMGDPRTIRYFGQLPMSDIAQADERAQWQQTAFAEQSGIRWAIIHRATGEFIGSCGFWRLIPAHDRAEIGYELSPDYWGQGLMAEVLVPILSFGFDDMDLHSVEAHIHPDNIGSRRVLEKLGFIQEGYFRENFYDPVEEQFTDTAVFSLLKSRWLPTQA